MGEQTSTVTKRQKKQSSTGEITKQQKKGPTTGEVSPAAAPMKSSVERPHELSKQNVTALGEIVHAWEQL